VSIGFIYHKHSCKLSFKKNSWMFTWSVLCSFCFLSVAFLNSVLLHLQLSDQIYLSLHLDQSMSKFCHSDQPNCESLVMNSNSIDSVTCDCSLDHSTISWEMKMHSISLLVWCESVSLWHAQVQKITINLMGSTSDAPS